MVHRTPLLVFLALQLTPLVALPPSARAKEAPPPSSVSISEIAKKAIPAVVNINSVREGDAAEKRSMGVGSGVILREDGLIVTSYHVIEGANKVTVTLQGRTEALKAKVLAGDSRTDIALLRIEPPASRLPTLKLGDSDRVRVGDSAVAVGNPFGFSHTVTSGIVSARGRQGASMGPFGDPGPDVDDMIQTDAAINPGNSGGPLLNGDGEMVGLNAAIFSQSGAFIGIGFAIPSSVVREITDQLLKNGRVIRGWLGVTAQNLDEHLARKFRTEAKGALISDIRAKGPAQLAGLRPGDIIRSFDKQPVTDSPSLKTLAAKTPAGKSVDVEFLREGRQSMAHLTIREQPQESLEDGMTEAGLPGKVEEPLRKPRTAADLGLTLQNVPPDLRGLMGLSGKEGVLVGQVTPGSLAADAGLSSGDVVLMLENQPVTSTEETSARITRWLRAKKAREQDALLMLVQRGPGDRVFIAVPLL